MPRDLILDIWGTWTLSRRPMPISPQRFWPRMCFLNYLSSVSKVWLHRWYPDFVDLDTQIYFSAKKSQIFLHMIDFFILRCMFYRPKKITRAFYHIVRSIWRLLPVCRKKFWIWMLLIDYQADLINRQNCRFCRNWLKTLFAGTCPGRRKLRFWLTLILATKHQWKLKNHTWAFWGYTSLHTKF